MESVYWAARTSSLKLIRLFFIFKGLKGSYWCFIERPTTIREGLSFSPGSLSAKIILMTYATEFRCKISLTPTRDSVD